MDRSGTCSINRVLDGLDLPGQPRGARSEGAIENSCANREGGPRSTDIARAFGQGPRLGFGAWWRLSSRRDAPVGSAGDLRVEPAGNEVAARGGIGSGGGILARLAARKAEAAMQRVAW